MLRAAVAPVAAPAGPPPPLEGGTSSVPAYLMRTCTRGNHLAHNTTCARDSSEDLETTLCMQRCLPCRESNINQHAPAVSSARAGGLASQRCTRPPRTARPPLRASSSALSTLDRHTSQASSVPACVRTRTCVRVCACVWVSVCVWVWV